MERRSRRAEAGLGPPMPAPLIVFEDADIEAVAPLVVTALTKFNGEFCMTGSRVLVQRSVADAWRERIASLLKKAKDVDRAQKVPAPSRRAPCGPTPGESSTTLSKRVASNTAASDARGVFAPWKNFRR